MLWNVRDKPRIKENILIFKNDRLGDLQARAEWVARECGCIASFNFRGVIYETTLHVRKSK